MILKSSKIYHFCVTICFLPQNTIQRILDKFNYYFLKVFVDNVSNLPYPKANLEPSPFVEVTLGRVSQRTPVKVKTVNPLFQSKFIFFVKQPEGQELKFVVSLKHVF